MAATITITMAAVVLAVAVALAFRVCLAHGKPTDRQVRALRRLEHAHKEASPTGGAALKQVFHNSLPSFAQHTVPAAPPEPRVVPWGDETDRVHLGKRLTGDDDDDDDDGDDDDDDDDNGDDDDDEDDDDDDDHEDDDDDDDEKTVQETITMAAISTAAIVIVIVAATVSSTAAIFIRGHNSCRYSNRFE